MKIIKALNNLQKESGSALVIVAISMVVMLGFTAMVIDGGKLYLEKSKLQKAMDAAVLAGAQGLMVSEAEAKSIAQNVSGKNDVSVSYSELPTTPTSIKATKQKSVDMAFAKVLGFNGVPVAASAKAIVGQLKSANGIAPIAVAESGIPNGTNLTCINTGNTQGNCGLLAIAGNGANEVKKAFENGATYTVGSSASVDTEPGKKVGPIDSAISTLIKNDENKPYCQQASTADNTCDRLIYVVIIDTWEGVQGKDSVTVTGLAAYWIKEYTSNRVLVGEFVKRYLPGEIVEAGQINKSTLYTIKLIE